MAAGKGKGTKLTKAVAKEKKGAVRAEKGKEKKGKDFSSEDEVDELEKEVQEEEEDEGEEESESEEEDRSHRTPETVKRKRQSIEENEAEVRRLEAIEADILKKKLRLQQAVNQHTVRIKNHVPVVVSQEDVDEYGSVESAVHGRVVEAEKVCNRDELNRIRLIEFNSIGFDLISLNRICLSTGPAGTSAAPITDAKGPDMHRPVAAVKVRGQLQEGWWPCSSDGDDHCPGQARQLGGPR